MSTSLVVQDQDGENRQTESRESEANLKAALARTAARSAALYFSRPVRLFRPSKVSGWHSLRSLASLEGSALTPGFVRSLVKDQGFTVIPKHFVPPMLVNILLGTVLWTSYSEASSILEPYIGNHPTMTAALSGAIAGGTQAVVAAPAENVRLLFEGGSGHHSWSHAWKEVFRGTVSREPTSRAQNIEDVRRVKRWMTEVGEMAGRGWNGWGWGCAKDMSGFAIFFSIFEVTRRVASEIRDYSVMLVRRTSSQDESIVRFVPRVVHGVTLVTGGVLAGLAYEFSGRPWDNARRIVHIQRLASPGSDRSPSPAILRKCRQEGLITLFRNPSLSLVANSEEPAGYRPKLTIALRTLGRVGPWGIGFLAWEAFGPGLQLT